jgi:hypothetical protein
VLVFTAADTNPPPFTDFNSVAVSYGQAGIYAYDNVALSKIRAVPAPVAGADDYAVGRDATLTVPAPGVLGNDSDPTGYPIAAIRVTSPAHGTLALNTDGGFVYTPAAGYSGADSFTYQANNSYAGSPLTTVTLTVTNDFNLPPLLSVSTSGSEMILSGTGGTPGATANILQSTNIALPMQDWALATSVILDGAGYFSVTNTVDPSQPQQYFRVHMP